jgi:anti-anti-sigma regulatory factor
MVFSLFKKKAQKVPQGEIMRPKPAFAPTAGQSAPTGAPEEGEKPREPLPDLEFTPGAQSVSGAKQPAAKPGGPKTKAEMDFILSEFEREFTDSSVMGINVDHGADSIQADVEQVAVLYANGQDAVVRPLLESLLGAYPGTEGLRLWQMLFDFLLLSGDRDAFDKLAADFVDACEMSPPAWAEPQTVPKVVAAGPAVTVCELQGLLTADDINALTPLTNALRDKRPLRVDCSRLLGCDDEIAGRLADLLMSARRQGAVIVLDQVEGIMPRLRGRLTPGEARNARTWLLLLELLQRYGTQDDFEQCAIDFAVTFERSPPSWEGVPAPTLPVAKPAKRTDNAHYLSGEIRNSRFDDLIAVLNLQDNVVLDFSGVRRLDFFSAGQLVNRLSPFKANGKEVIIRSPNHLVAELMAVVGLNKFARIIVPKS